MKYLVKITIIIILALFVSSCRFLRPSLMLKTPKGYKYEAFKDSMTDENYKIVSTDAISIRVYANDGFALVDKAATSNISSGGNINNAGPQIEETVDKQGLYKAPIIGKVKLAGKTLREAQDFLEQEYSNYYVKPYVQLKITNKRVIVFPGSAGAAQVVQMQNNNMTVFEALAYAGGITDDGKAYKIKLVRRTGPETKVYLIDLSTINGLAQGNITVMANDVIYVEPRPRYVQRTVSEVAPYMSLLSAGLTLYLLFSKK